MFTKRKYALHRRLTQTGRKPHQSATLCTDEGQMRKGTFTLYGCLMVHFYINQPKLHVLENTFKTKLVNVTFLTCPFAESQQQNR